MKAFVKKQVTSTQTILEKTTCDLCGESTSGDNWADGNYEHDEITIQRVSGAHYPEGDYRETASFDICPKCWEEKLVPWMASQGASPTVKEADW